MRADAREKRAALITAAWDLFAEDGPEVPLRTVAARADVGIATLYRHFPTREDLMVGLIEDMAGRVLAIIERHVADWDGRPEGWRGFVHEIAALKVAALAERSIAVIPVDGRVWVETEPVREEFLGAYRTILDLAASSGFVEDDLSPWRFHLGLAAVSRPMPEKAERFAPGQADWLIDTFIDGLQGRRAAHG